MTNVLVTGGAGFIGSHLAERLVERGASVTIVDNLSKGQLDNIAHIADDVVIERLDVTDGAFDRILRERAPAQIFHLAGFASAPDSVHAVRADFDQNAVATLNLLEGVRSVSPDARVVFASSAAVYGEGHGVPLRESDETVPLAPYGVSKLAAERYVSVYAKVYGLATASLRLFPVYGPRLRRHVMWDLMCKLRDDPDELVLEGDGTQVRDFLYVANAVDALLLAADEAPLEGEVYNASDGRAVTIREVAERISEAMGLDPRSHVHGRRPCRGRPAVDGGHLAPARARLPSTRVGLEEGLAETVAWFRAESARP